MTDCPDKLANRADSTQEMIAEIERLRESKDAAYEERNRLVALLASMFPSGIKQTDIPGWDAEWHGCVYIDFPWGQASWHFHDSQSFLFDHLPPYSGEWDGHTTEQKYQNIEVVASGTEARKDGSYASRGALS